MVIDRVRIKTSAQTDDWPFTIPAVQQIIAKGLIFSGPITLLLGANGSGKSTLVEAIGEAYGLDVRGGHGGRRYGSHLEKSVLGKALELRLNGFPVTPKRSRAAGFFLRAETATEMLERMTSFGVAGYGDHRSDLVSHGESYLQVLAGRFTGPGLYLLDEAEGPLSFESTMLLLRTLVELVRFPRTQVIYATHSPLVAGIPGAQILQLDDHGIAASTWSQLESVLLWQSYLARPERFFD